MFPALNTGHKRIFEATGLDISDLREEHGLLFLLALRKFAVAGG